MGLWDKVAEAKAEKENKSDDKPKVVFRNAGKVKFGSDATANFNKIVAAKKAMAAKMRKDQDSVLGDSKYKYIRKNGKAVGFTQGD